MSSSAHPPWVPSTGDTPWLFRDGGDVGEAVIRRLIEGIGGHLGSAGTAVIAVSLGRRYASSAPYERRVRGWLGADGR